MGHPVKDVDVPPAPKEHGKLLLGASDSSGTVVVVAVGLFRLLLGEEEMVFALLAFAQRNVVLVGVIAGTITLKINFMIIRLRIMTFVDLRCKSFLLYCSVRFD